MTTTDAALLGGALGVVAGVFAALFVWRPARPRRSPAPPQPGGPVSAGTVLAVLGSSEIILDTGDIVVSASPPAVAAGLVRERELVNQQLRELTHRVRRAGQIRDSTMDSRRSRQGDGTARVRARIALVGSGHVLVLVDDLTDTTRVEQGRHDFIENVSHELKTPVGGHALLAEAVLAAREGPAAVERFARRMTVEAGRLGHLVQEIVDLSRLQAHGGVEDPEPVGLERVCADAAEDLRVPADSRGITLILPEPAADASFEHVVRGDRQTLILQPDGEGAASSIVGRSGRWLVTSGGRLWPSGGAVGVVWTVVGARDGTLCCFSGMPKRREYEKRGGPGLSPGWGGSRSAEGG